MFKKKKTQTLQKRAPLDPKSQQGVLQERARNDVISTAKTTLGLTSQVLGVLPTPVPKFVADLLLHFVTKTEQTINNATTEKNLAQDLASESAQLQMAISESASSELKAQVDILVQNLMSLSDYRTTSNHLTVRRWFTSAEHALRLAETKQKQLDALQQFSVLANMRIEQKVDEIASSTILQRLAYSDGASWKPESVCAAQTRVDFLRDTQEWIHQPTSDGPRILLLREVDGAGKSAIAHSVAQISSQDPKCDLVSCFFFDREVAGRNTPERLFSTLAFELASHDSQCGAHMSNLVINEPSLAGSSLTRLFDELIVPSVNASSRYCAGKPKIIVIDALDEVGCDRSVLQIIQGSIRKLPATFRFFITSRPYPALDHVLHTWPAVRKISLDLSGSTNKSDIREFIQQRCPSVAAELGLDATWPGPVIQNRLAEKAEGLFVWISVVFSYICDPSKTCNPDDRLRMLLEDDRAFGLKPGEKMDSLFRQILSTCRWKDPAFGPAFNLVVGTLVALKTPLSPEAFAFYLGDQPGPVIKRVESLSPLITGLRGDSDSVRLIHLSVREFLTSTVSKDTLHYVDKQEANSRLALTCLHIFNHDLSNQHVGVGYLKVETQDEGVPFAPAASVPEQLRYACNFWKAHASSVQDSVPPNVDSAFRTFLESHLTTWIELSASLGQLQTLENAPEWVRTCTANALDPGVAKILETYSNMLYRMYLRLYYDARLEEALQAIKEVVVIRRDLAKSKPDTFRRGLSWALNNISICYGKLGRQEEALSAIQESVIIKQELAKQRPTKFNPDLAMSLNNSSIHLSELGKHEEALSAIKESVAIRRELAKQQPAKFNPDLALSLGTLSSGLSDLGHKAEALSASLEAVTICRELVRERPTEFNPILASSLTNLSPRLADLGQHEEALSAAKESIAIYQELTMKQSATFNPNLAKTLVTLSNCLDNVGQPEEALSAIEEAVTMYRDLAKERPAAFNKELAISVNKLPFRLSTLGRHDEALTAIIEAVTMWRHLATERPILFNHRLKKSLKMLSYCLKKVGREEEAGTALAEAKSLDTQ